MQGVNNIAGVMAFLLFSCIVHWHKYCAHLEEERRGGGERERDTKLYYTDNYWSAYPISRIPDIDFPRMLLHGNVLD